MKRLALFATAALIAATLVPEESAAQRAGARGARVAPGDGIAARGAVVGPRARAVDRRDWDGRRRPGVAAGIAAGIGAGAYYGYASSYGDGYYGDSYSPQGSYAPGGSYGYRDSCLAWNGNQWVSTCSAVSPGPAGGGQWLPSPYEYYRQ
jgi:hypothetical protein